MLEVRDMRFAYSGGNRILDGVSFESAPGEVVAVLGNNGAGKSTLIKCMERILSPETGAVLVDGTDLLTLKRREHAKYAAYVPQEPPKGELTVFDAVLLGRRPYITWDATAGDKRAAEQALELLGLNGHALRKVSELSGGEQQKVAIARALAQEPRVLLLDEPTSSLDPRNQHETMRLVRRIAAGKDVCAVVILHDLNLAIRYCDKFLFLKDGTVFAYGGREIMNAENIEEVYGMHVHIFEYMGIPVVVPFPDIKL